MFVRLLASNIYTTQFYTKVETNSIISQTSSNINLSVDQKLSNYSTTTQMNAAIDIKANQITSTVSQTYATKTELNTSITQTSNAIMLEVNQKMDEDDFTQAQIIAQINDGVSSAKIRADNINLTGYLTISSASSTYATLSGLSGGTTTINGGCITTGSITSTNYAEDSGGTTTAGTKIQLNNGVIKSKNFSIDSSGNASINGKVTARSGYIGNGSNGWTIANTAIYNGKSSLTANTAGVYIGTTGISLGTGSTFKVTSDGALTATNATISGNITATSGTIGGCTISNGVLTVQNANIGQINGSKIMQNTLNGNTLTDASVYGSSLVNGSVYGGKIANNTITGDKILDTTEITCGKLTSSGYVKGSIITGGGFHASPILGNDYPSAFNGYWVGDDYFGKNYSIPVPISLTVQDGRVTAQTWRLLVFKSGILVDVLSSW